MPSPADSVFVVNPRSGGQAGRRLLGQLRQRLGGARVHDLGEIDLGELVRRSHGVAAALVACGGDGTAAALLEHAWRVSATDPTPVAVWPLGTGNDLARFGGVPIRATMDQRLAWLEAAVISPLDRWRMQGPAGDRSWFNYCSWGCDARIAQRFHRLRDLHPWAFATPLTNKACYVGLGLQENGAPLALTATADDQTCRLPRWMRSLVLANIPSYAGGRPLGAGIRVDDGRCDAFALPSGVALGLGLSGARRLRGLGAYREMRLSLSRPVFMQIDGEPLAAPAGEYRIFPGGRVRLLSAG